MRKRSKYRPGRVLQNPVQHVLAGLKPLAQALQTSARLQIGYHGALDLLRRGKATRDDILCLDDMVNMAEAMVRVTCIGVELLPEIQAAKQALLSIGRRNRFVAAGPELVALNRLAEIHDAQFRAITVGEAEKALDYIERKLSK